MIFITTLFAFCFTLQAARVDVSPASEMTRLLTEVDADHDNRITILDKQKAFWLKSLNGEKYEVQGTYYLSNLLQELKIADERHLDFVDGDRIFERPVERISRLIRDFYWDNLTRRVDASHLAEMLDDTKVKNPSPRVVYVSDKDPKAFAYFTRVAKKNPKLNFVVAKLDGGDIPTRHGLLALGLTENKKGQLEGIPFIVPGGRFNEMYGWDSYFEGLGLLQDGKIDLAKAMLDNLIYEIDNYGKVLNANRSYYFDRSQPPFLTSYIRAVYAKLPKNEASRHWLKHALDTSITEYKQVWMSAGRLTDTGLSRYGGPVRPGIPPEVESGHFDFVFAAEAKHYGLDVAELERRYLTGQYKSLAFDEFFAQDRAVRESGHDTTSRWTVNGKDLAADFVTVDLNSLLYKYEIDIAAIYHDEFHDAQAEAEWRLKADARKSLILKYLWHPDIKIFTDYNFKTKTPSTFVSATGFYPLWAVDPARPQTRILNPGDAAASVRALLKELEAPGGILSTSKKSRDAAGGDTHPRQWDYPSGWAPHQILAWTALKNYEQDELAHKLIYRWLYMITRNAVDYNGTIPEKFDVMKRSHAVFAEYGNMGTTFAYITREGFGWMNASYQLGLSELPADKKAELDRLVPPEWLDVR